MERTHRAANLQLIIQVGAQLFPTDRYPIHTAMVLFHRFYTRRSMLDLTHPVKDITFACLLLAGKAEEHIVAVDAVVLWYLREVEKLTIKRGEEKSEQNAPVRTLARAAWCTSRLPLEGPCGEGVVFLFPASTRGLWEACRPVVQRVPVPVRVRVHVVRVRLPFF